MPASPSSQLFVWHKADGSHVEIRMPTDEMVTVGRDSSNTIVLSSSVVSSRHAVMTWTGGSFTVIDQRSANGTTIKGQRITEASLFPGDIIEFGNERLEWVRPGDDSNEDAAPRRGKTARLAIAAAVTIVVVTPLLFVAAGRLFAPANGDTAQPGLDVLDPTAGATANFSGYDSERARAIEVRANAAGASAHDWIFDEAVLEYRAERLTSAIGLLAGVLQRAPDHPGARRLLAAAWLERNRQIRSLHRQAASATESQHIQDAVRAWEGITQLTEPTDPIHLAAQQAIRKLKAAPRP